MLIDAKEKYLAPNKWLNVQTIAAIGVKRSLMYS